MIDDGTRPSALFAMAGWSWKVCTYRGIEYHFSWTLFVIMLFAAVHCVHDHRIGMIPIGIVIPPVAVILHLWGHLLATRWVGGHASTTNLCFLGDMTDLNLPLRPWPQFCVPAAGIAVSALLWLLCWTALIDIDVGTWKQFSVPPLSIFPTLSPGDDSWWQYILQGMTEMSCALMLWNLLPIIVFDGGRMWRAILWPLTGLVRGVWWSILGGITCASLITVFAVNATDWMFLIFGISLIFAGIMEFRSMKGGFDLVLGTEPRLYNRIRSSLWSRWNEHGQQRRQERDEREIAAEQVILDQLLAKVAAGGLPALSAKERATLAQISKRQQQRQGT